LQKGNTLMIKLDSNRTKATLYVVPAFLLHALIITVPALTLFYYSFTEWNGLGKPIFNGLSNFKRMIFDDPEFLASLVNNVIYLVIFLTAPIIVGLLIAMMVVKAGKAQMLYRTVFFLPYIISAIIAGKIFMVYYDPYVGITRLFDYIGLPALANISLIGDGRFALFAVAFVDYWHWWGFVMVLFLAALHQVDAHLYEAASIDGANKFQKFVHITVPQVMPTMITLLMLTMIGAFLTFDYIYAMTQGGPAGATEIAATWIYKKSFVGFEAGYGSALSLTISLLCILIYFGFRQLQKKGWDI
jgi:raffinose/stachyose/melibiose transport system permease protein